MSYTHIYLCIHIPKMLQLNPLFCTLTKHTFYRDLPQKREDARPIILEKLFT